MSEIDYSIVIPTVGRSSLSALLASLAAGRGPRPREVVVVDDRRNPCGPLPAQETGLAVRVVTGRAAGPAAARNDGWRAAGGRWVAFLDDDVVCPEDWAELLEGDIAAAPQDAAGIQGRISVPLPTDRRPTDWERNVAGLEHACWATADLAYRRDVLDEVGGFDERFPRAYREDADLGLRVTEAGWLIVRGERTVVHPVRPADFWVSVRLQRGNADDSLMRGLHGPDWRLRCAAGPGRTGRHAAAVAASALAATGLLTRPRSAQVVGLAAWSALVAELWWTRVRPGPRTPGELLKMSLTTPLLPHAAIWHRAAGRLRRRGVLADTSRAPLGRPGPHLPPVRRRAGRADPTWRPKAVLFDRDGTLVVDVAYNGDPDKVVLQPGARQAVNRLRRAGLAVGVVTNQSGMARGLLSADQVGAVNCRVDELAGPFDVWAVCPHGPDEGCGCRKPEPGLVLDAAGRLGVDPSQCALVGDIGSDVVAARTAGARPVLVPTAATRTAEVSEAPTVARSLLEAADLILGGRC